MNIDTDHVPTPGQFLRLLWLPQWHYPGPPAPTVLWGEGTTLWWPLAAHLPRASLPHTPWQMDITQHRNYLFVKSLPEEEEEEAACSQEFYQLEMKSSQSPSIRRQRANVREHSKHRYIQPSCMAAERGLCARLPPSFGYYTALNIVGKDPTDQSTSWMSTTDEPSDHEPMLASSVHV